MERVDFGNGVRQLVAEQPRLRGKKGIVGSGRGLWVLEGDSGYWKGIVGKKGRKRRDLGGGLGSWKGWILGTGRVSFWVLEGDSGYWKGILGKKRRKRRDLGGGLGSWKGIVGPGRGLWVLEGSGFGSR